jgi:hypothetical protein
VEGVTSTALRVTWDPPEDDGGRQILTYEVRVEGLVFTVPATDPRMLLIRDNTVVREAMMYK